MVCLDEDLPSSFPCSAIPARLVTSKRVTSSPTGAGRKYDNPIDALATLPRVALVQTPAASVRPGILLVCEGIPDALSAAGAGCRAGRGTRRRAPGRRARPAHRSTRRPRSPDHRLRCRRTWAKRCAPTSRRAHAAQRRAGRCAADERTRPQRLGAALSRAVSGGTSPTHHRHSSRAQRHCVCTIAMNDRHHVTNLTLGLLAVLFVVCTAVWAGAQLGGAPLRLGPLVGSRSRRRSPRSAASRRALRRATERVVGDGRTRPYPDPSATGPARSSSSRCSASH